jgi:protein-disulfide isomerase
MSPRRRHLLTAIGTASLGATTGCLGLLGPSVPSCSGGQITDLAAPSRGESTAPVTVEVYSDYACPHCADFADQAAPRITDLIENGDVHYVHRDYPVPVNGRSFPVANAARAVQDYAGNEAFWQFYELAFGHQGEFSTNKLQEYAKQAGAADVDVQAVLEDQRYCERIKQDRKRGNEKGVSGTPTVFVDDEKLAGPAPKEFEEAVRAALR